MNPRLLRYVVVVGAGLWVAGCGRAGEVGPRPARAGDSQPPSAGSSAPPAGSASAPDVVVLPEQTSAGGAVIAVGEPRLQLSESSLGDLVIRAGARRVFAVDRDEVKIWDLDTGRLVQRVAPPERRPIDLSVAVSADGQWMAMGHFEKLHVLAAPFTQAAFMVPLAYPTMFSPDGELLVTSSLDRLSLVSLAQRRVVSTSPPVSKTSIEYTAATSGVGQPVYWVREKDVLRWSPATSTLELLYTARGRLNGGKIAARAPIAMVHDDTSLIRLDLSTGVPTRVARLSPSTVAVSGSGSRVAARDVGFVRVLDAKTGKELVASEVSASVPRVAYSEHEGVAAYLEDHVIRVLDVPGGVRRYEVPSRFAGWLAGGSAAIARGGALFGVALPGAGLAPVGADAVVGRPPARPAGAPAWATWVTASPGGGVIAAEPSARRGLAPAQRWRGACPARLRVWTSAGGTRTVALKRTDADLPLEQTDPCWEIGGGWVVGVTRELVKIYDPTSGRQVAALDAGRPPSPRPELAHEYWAVSVSPTGQHLALWWRRADVWAPPHPDDPDDPDGMDSGIDPEQVQCEEGSDGVCKMEYFAELWSLRGTPQRVWQTRYDAPQTVGRTWPYPKLASGPIAFTPDGRYVLLGFDDGDIVVRAVADARPTRTERLHRAPVTRIEVAPSGAWVLSEDSAGEQRLWPLAAPTAPPPAAPPVAP
jgi:WD40 repeat protein